MALRVLLADESSTIKRVMQLALQDYAVEVKSVPIGIDVLSVAKSFQPDLIFADVLLPKRSGYEVCKDLKADLETQKIPLVLMWSGFMELDESKAQDARADRRLEKPFEPETLRQLVQDLVKKTQDNPLSEYLTFPEMPEISESEEDFSQVPLHGGAKEIAPVNHSTQEEWSRQSLGQISITPQAPLSNSTVDLESVDPEKYIIPETDLQKPHIESHGDFEEVTFVKPPPPKSTRPGGEAYPGLDPLTAEQILREEARQVIENIAWKIIPEIAERIVREEINKLLQESEKSI